MKVSVLKITLSLEIFTIGTKTCSPAMVRKIPSVSSKFLISIVSKSADAHAS